MTTEINKDVVDIIVKKAKDKVATNSKLIKPEKEPDLIGYLHIMIEKEVPNAD